MLEIWRPVAGYEGLYEVSDKGRVKSLNFRWTGQEKVMKPWLSGLYLRVDLCGKKKLVHCLVAKAFPEICGEMFEGCVINHKDENPLNNVASNLEVCTVAYNNSYGTAIQRKTAKLKNGPCSKPVLQILNGKVIKKWKSMHEIQESGICHASQVCLCCKNTYGHKTAGGFEWQYA